jgi:hypothetical protein
MVPCKAKAIIRKLSEPETEKLMLNTFLACYENLRLANACTAV